MYFIRDTPRVLLIMMAPRKWSLPPPRCRLRHLLLSLVGASLLVLAGLLTGVDVKLGLTVVPVLVPEDSTPLVDTPGCSIPGFSIYDPTVVRFISPRRKVHCSALPPLTVSTGASVSLNWTVLTQYGVSSDAVRCCAQAVRRLKQDRLKYDNDADNLIDLSSCTPFTAEGQYHPPSLVEAAVVQCRDNTALLPGPFYTNVHYFFPRDKVVQKIQAFEGSGGWAANPDRVNVIIFGTDSVSRLNLERHSPNTFRWLKNHPDHLDFVGFNRVGANTDPNALALILGLHPTYMNNVPCHSRAGVVWDDCPFLWKQFSEQGYVTVYGEDAPIYAIFHYNKPGYVDQPTDFYNRPGFLASDRMISFSEGHRAYYLRNCQGPTPSIKVIHDYALQSLRTFNDVPVFGLFWSTSTSHEFLSEVSQVDDLQVEFLSSLKRFGHLNNTVVLFLSDHGLRFGEIRSTYIGSLEESLPYMFMLVPPWFKERYPALMKNLEVNQERLVTNFDFHHTMKDFLHQNFQKSSGVLSNLLNVRLTNRSPLQENKDVSNQINQTRNYSNSETSNLFDHHEGWNFVEEELDIESNTNSSLGHSLFEEVSPYRTCEDVKIPEHFCTCLSTAEIDTGSQLALDAAHYVIDELNAAVKNFSVCHRWSLREVLLARSGGYSTSALAKGTKLGPLDGGGEREVAVLITISVAPGDARFEATLARTSLGAFRVTAEISRITRFDGHDDEGGDGGGGSHKHTGDRSEGDAPQNNVIPRNTSGRFNRRRSRRAVDSSTSEGGDGGRELSSVGRLLSEEVQPSSSRSGPKYKYLRRSKEVQSTLKDVSNSPDEDQQNVAEKNRQDCSDRYIDNQDFARIRQYCYC